MEENRIKIIRSELGGITQGDLAFAIGFPVHKIKDAEAGKVKISTEMAEALEEKFNFSFRWVLTGHGPMYRAKGGQTSQIATGNGIIQAGGGQITIIREGSEPVWIKTDHPLKDDIEDIFLMLKLYGSPKLIQEIKERLQRVKAAVEGE